MRKIIFIILLVIAFNANGQYFQRYHNLSVAGAPYLNEQFFSGIKTAKNYNLTPSSFYYAGIGASYVSTAVAISTSDRVRFVRTSMSGVANQNWGYSFANAATPTIFHHAEGRSICEIADTVAVPGYMFCGLVRDNAITGATSTGGGDALFGRINSTGNVAASFKLDFGGGRDVATCIRPSVFVPNTFIMCGYTQKLLTPGTVAVSECWVARVNKTGTVFWACRYNFDPVMVNNVISAEQRANSLCENPTTGEIFVVGSIRDFSALAPTTDALIFKLNSAGAVLCQTAWHIGPDDEFQSVKYTKDNNLIIGGFTNGSNVVAGFYNMWLLKFSQFCNPLWQKLLVVNGLGAVYQSKCYDVVERVNAANVVEYYLTGPSYPPAGPVTHIYKTDAAGNGLNHWPYASLVYDHGFGIDFVGNGQINPGLVVFSNNDGVLSPGFADSYILKTYFNGCTCTNYCPANNPTTVVPVLQMKQIPKVSTCQFVKSKLSNVRYTYNKASICNQNPVPGGSNVREDLSATNDETNIIQLYPSPVMDNLIVESLSENTVTGTYMVVDMQGKVILTGQIALNEDNNAATVFVGDLPPGVYSLVINGEGNVIRKSFIKQ